MSYIISLRHIRKTQVALAGGKGAALGELFFAGVPVPDGFVLTTEAHKQNDLQSFEDGILAAFEALHSPFVAVRSSATAEDGHAAAWAGQLESYVPTTRQALLQNIQKCWDSLNSRRAKTYREQAGLAGTPVHVAVIVQRMVDADVSGIAFSAHPVTGNVGQVVIEAVHGLGEAAVGGHVTPDTFVLHKASGDILDAYPSAQSRKLARSAQGTAEWVTIEPAPTLLPRHQQKLLAHVRRIEDHFGFPCDIEWTFKGETFYIVQSRPITTL